MKTSVFGSHLTLTAQARLGGTHWNRIPGEVDLGSSAAELHPWLCSKLEICEALSERERWRERGRKEKRENMDMTDCK